MTRRSRIGRTALGALAALVAGVLAIAAWWGSGRRDGAPASGPSAASAAAGDRRAGPGLPGASPRGPGPALPGEPARPAGDVAITGRVIDILQQRPVAGVEVVLRGAAGDATAITGGDGGYAVRVAPGVYRAFVRDDAVMSFGRRDPGRLPGDPSAEVAGVPDEALMTMVVAARDTEAVDLSVLRGGIVAGRVVAAGGAPIAGAVVHAAGGALRPTLATDLAESGPDGSFELRLPPGAFEIVASHPRFAGVASDRRTRTVVRPGDRLQTTLVLTAGCVIAGRVTAADGSSAGDGAIERQWGPGDLAFAPAGQIEPDGTFRWVTTEAGDLTLRAWPWRSPPSQPRQFSCRDGARFEGVVFQLADERPDLEGVLVDSAGKPVGFAYVDLRPLDAGGIAQQERSDAQGRWRVFHLPAGRYLVIAQADGKGVARTVVASPQGELRLELGGTGRLEGTTPRLASGSFELELESCFGGNERLALAPARRLVTVTGGRFAVDDLPACPLAFSAIWHGRRSLGRAAIVAGDATPIELDVGAPRDKTVRGVVRDAAGAPVPGAVVTVLRPGEDAPAATAVTDGAGAYSVRAASGASLRASARGRIGQAQVGGADIDAEQLDLVLEAPRGDAATGG